MPFFIILTDFQATFVSVIPIMARKEISGGALLCNEWDIVLHIYSCFGNPEKTRLFIKRHGFHIGGPGVQIQPPNLQLSCPLNSLFQQGFTHLAAVEIRVDVQ